MNRMIITREKEIGKGELSKMKAKKILITAVIATVAVIVLAGIAAASAGNVVSDWLTGEIVSLNEGGLKLADSENQEVYFEKSQEQNFDNPEAQFNKGLPYKFKTALAEGHVYQYEMFMNEDRLHDYRFLHAFSKTELEDAEFTEDYSRIVIQGNTYVIKWGYPGELNEIDRELPDMEEWTVILRVFTEENWKEGFEIYAREVFEGTRERIVFPIYEGRAAIYSNEDESFIRDLTEEEIRSAEISENGLFVRIGKEIYITTLRFDEDFQNVEEVRLKPQEGYKGDAGFQNPEEYKFFTIDEWMEG